MNALWLLMGLLLLAYLGSFLVGGRAIRGIGLPSGVEYVVLGFVFGPKALGVLEGSALEVFDPFAHVALGWLMFVVGATYAVTGNRRVGIRRLAGGWLVALVTGALVSAVVWLFLGWGSGLSPRDRLLMAGGVGAVASETTRYAVRWVVERHRASGPVAQLIGEIAEGDDLVPLLATAVLFSFAPPAQLVIDVPRWGLVGVTLGIGVVLGAMTAALLGRTFRLEETWSVLLGMTLFTVGISGRLGLSTVTTMFALGLTLSTLSPHRRELSVMLAPTEQPVILPALLLAGAHVDFGAAPYLPFVIGVAIAARILAKGLAGLGLLSFSVAARPAGGRLGLGLLSTGALSMSLGLAFALRFPGAIGAVVLATAAGVTLFGELVGPASLRAVLTRAGEMPVDPPPAAPAGGEAA
jgi:Kef-type K+ transport system membrane component KefB